MQGFADGGQLPHSSLDRCSQRWCRKHPATIYALPDPGLGVNKSWDSCTAHEITLLNVAVVAVVRSTATVLVGSDQARADGETYVRRAEVSSGTSDGIN